MDVVLQFLGVAAIAVVELWAAVPALWDRYGVIGTVVP